MVELRKRKAPAEPAPAPLTKKKSNPIQKAVEKAKDLITGNDEGSTDETPPVANVAVGDTITLDGFGGEVETHDGQKTTLKALVDESTAGVVLFTYPKASTPGCTTQACLFRDDYTPLTATGFAIFGLSRDSPKANTAFKTKQKLPYALLCDPEATLLSAIGMKKSASGTTRGVFVVSKEGKVLATEAGGPAATVAAVKKLVVEQGTTTEDVEMGNAPTATESGTTEPTGAEAAPENQAAANEAAAPPAEGSAEDVAKADVAGEVADTAEKLDASSVHVTDTAMNGEAGDKDDKAKADVAADVAETAAQLDAPATST